MSVVWKGQGERERERFTALVAIREFFQKHTAGQKFDIIEIYFGTTFILRCPCHTLHILTIIITIKYAKLHASNPKPNPNPNPNSRYMLILLIT